MRSEAGDRATRETRLQEHALKADRRTGVPQGRLDDDAVKRQVRQLPLNQGEVFGTCGDVDVVRSDHWQDPVDGGLQHRPIAHKGVKLLGEALPAVGPEPRANAAGTDHALHSGSPFIHDVRPAGSRTPRLLLAL